MPFTKEFNKDFKIVDNHLVLSDEYKRKLKPKKLTATRFSAVLGLSDYASDVKTWCDIVKIFAEQPDELVTKTGEIIEPKMRQYLSLHFDVPYKCWIPREVNWDCFPEVEIFGGIPDGEPMKNGVVDYSSGKPLIEIKTSSIDKFVWKKSKDGLRVEKDSLGCPIVKAVGAKRATWFNPDGSVKVPVEYQYQIGLYLYLRNQLKGVLACCFLKPEDYLNPNDVDVTKREVVATYVEINRKKMQQAIDKAAEWYKKYVLTGVSPELKEDDYQWLLDQGIVK